MIRRQVLVLINFEGTMGDEITVRMGDVVKNVTKASEDGWLEGELRGKRGIFPANFVKEVPVYLTGNSKREPRSIRTSTRLGPPKRMKQARTCEVVFAYSPVNEDELQLVVGETVEILSEIEDGWWMGIKNGSVGAFPSNFVREIFVAPKGAPKTPSRLLRLTTDRGPALVECCQVMFDYKAKAEDELDLKIGDVVVILRKETEDDGWWEGELNGRCGFFPDNFVMVIPPMDSLKVSERTKVVPNHRCPKTKSLSFFLFVFADLAKAEDELDLKIGDVVVILRKVPFFLRCRPFFADACPVRSDLATGDQDRPEVFGEAADRKGVFENDLEEGRFGSGSPPPCCALFGLNATLLARPQETEDDGWWEGELNGRCGFFPDNFVMVIPPMDSLKVSERTKVVPNHRCPKTKSLSFFLFVFADLAKNGGGPFVI
uniref:SH3 domain containing 21 n=1 Tax=Hippocampus comes TaxID=109280 RepID=A0A3Q2YZ52_HIPCM